MKNENLAFRNMYFFYYGPFWSKTFLSGSRKNSVNIGLLNSKPKLRKKLTVTTGILTYQNVCIVETSILRMFDENTSSKNLKVILLISVYFQTQKLRLT